MGRGGRRVTALVVMIIMLVGGVISTAPASAGGRSGPTPVPRLNWQADCYFGGIECASVEVPLDHDHPRGPTTTLALARLRATDPARRIGTLFVNPGGPGGSGVDFVLLGAREVLSPEVLARFDIVGFDPRGVSRSDPVRCVPFESGEQDPYQGLPAFPLTGAEEAARIRADRSFARACARNAAELLPHMSTANVARDLDLLRRAVGDEKLTYAGFSYGSFLGATYANLYPSKVRAMWVDGVLDPVAWTTGRGRESRSTPFSTRLDSGSSSAATMDAFLRACDAVGERCVFSAGDPRERYRILLRRLATNPPTDPETGEVLIGYGDAVAGLLAPLYFADAWPAVADQLQTLWELTEPGATTVVRQRAAARYAALAEPPPPSPNGVDAFNAVACVDSVNPRDPLAWTRAADRADRRAAPFGRLWTWESSRCAHWPVRDTDRYLGPFTRRTSAPVLIVGNRLDPATPYEGAKALHRLMPNSRLLTLDYAGHTSLGQSACVTRLTTRYLINGSLPRPGTVCRPDRQPFEPMTPQERSRMAAVRTVVGEPR